MDEKSILAAILAADSDTLAAWLERELPVPHHQEDHLPWAVALASGLTFNWAGIPERQALGQSLDKLREVFPGAPDILLVRLRRYLANHPAVQTTTYDLVVDTRILPIEVVRAAWAAKSRRVGQTA